MTTIKTAVPPAPTIPTPPADARLIAAMLLQAADKAEGI